MLEGVRFWEEGNVFVSINLFIFGGMFPSHGINYLVPLGCRLANEG